MKDLILAATARAVSPGYANAPPHFLAGLGGLIGRRRKAS